MNGKDAIRETLNLSHFVLKSYVGDLTDAELLKRPGPGCNHVAWQLGHLIASECSLLNSIRAGAAPELPADFAERHSKENKDSDDSGRFLSKQQYLDLTEKMHAATVALLGSYPESDFALPAPENFRKMFPTMGAMFILIATHPMMHAGQVVPIRRALGKPIRDLKTAEPAFSLIFQQETEAMAVKRVPDGVHRVTAHLTVRDAPGMMEFYKKAFGAVEKRRAPGPDGKSIMHAEMRIGDSAIFLNDEFPEMGAFSPLASSSTPVTLHLAVEDADKQFEQALAAGAEVVMPLADQFWGDRYGIVKDPSGHQWSIAHHVEDLTPAQMQERMAKAFCQ